MRRLPAFILNISLPLALVLGTGPALAADARAVTGSPLQAIPAEASTAETHVYIVQFKAPAAVQEPTLRTDGAADGSQKLRTVQAATLENTSPRASGNRRRPFDAGAPAVREYADGLTEKHDAVLASVGAGNAKLYSYRYALNGFAARLTPDQARKLQTRKDVRNVWEDGTRFVETSDSPAFLGLTASNGGLRSELGLRGENIVIGVIDSGIAPGHPSFDDKNAAKRPGLCNSVWAENSLLGLWLCKRFTNRPATLAYTPLPGWKGTCEAGERFRTNYCNNKLIGARYYIDGFLAQYDLDENEFTSPRDADGHGTHIASTAGGNVVQATLGGARVAKISGMAPRARIAVYKACWLEPGQLRATCTTADLTRAIEDAVADGVDIINYSVGSNDDINGPDDLALLAAADAGVLSVAAAGNEGPAPGSVVSPAAAPWVLAVGASSRRGNHLRRAIRVNSPASVKNTYLAQEAMFTPLLRDVGPLTLRLILVDDATIGNFAGTTGTTTDGCETLVNTTQVKGQIALIPRGGCTFETKIRNAQTAGAKAVVVINDQSEPILMTGTRGTVNIPALILGQGDGELLKERLLAGNSVEVTLDAQIFLTARDEGNQMQGFSARGPSLWEPNVLKPDLTAPGMDILAAYTPDVANDVRGERFQYLSGTSMAAPHVAGVAALLKEAHPDWSPAALKSALVTTARQSVRKEDGTTAADPFDFGGGHMVPNLAVKPGLVYDAGSSDYDAFMCGRGEPRVGVDCAALKSGGFATDGSDVNLPSIAISELVSEQVIRRRVTNVGAASRFTASVEAPTTIDVEVTPSVLSLGEGESADVEIRLTTADTTLGAWQFGALTWTSADAIVRSPLAIRAQPFAAPGLVSGSGTTGSVNVPLRVGYTGTYSALLSGLETTGQSQPEDIRAQFTNSVADDPNDLYTFVQPTGGKLPNSVRRIPLIVPAGTRYLRVALFNDSSSPGADLDLYLYSCPGFRTCTKQGKPSVGLATSDEVINLIPEEGQTYLTSGEYYVDVHGYDAPGGTANFKLFVWTVGANRGNATVPAPSSVTSGTASSLTVSWENLAPGLNLGLVTHTNGTSTLDQTVIEVTAP